MSLDILFTASTYLSAGHAIRMAASLHRIEARCEIVFCGPRRADLIEIEHQEPSVTCLLSPVDNVYFCRAMGLLYAMREEMEPAYLCSCDDDLEFMAESADILGELDRAQLETGFGVATFNNGAHFYQGMPGQIKSRVGDTLEMGWLNGDSMFIPWDVVMEVGVPDSLLSAPVTYFSEVEYEHRVKALLGRPSVAMTAKSAYYRHVFRDRGDPVTFERADRSGFGIAAGATFWKEKYGVEGIDVGAAENYPALMGVVKAAGEKAKRHLIFGGHAAPEWKPIMAELLPTITVLGKRHARAGSGFVVRGD